MAKVIYDDKNTRSIKEGQARRRLQEDSGEAPSQEQIYADVYKTPYPIFADEFGTPQAKNKIDKYLGNVFTASGKIRRGVSNNALDQRYIDSAGNVLGENEYDPLTRQRLLTNLRRTRQGARSNMFDRKFNQYRGERQQALGDYASALNQQNAALQGANEAEAAQIQRQQEQEDYLWKKQVDAAYRAPRGGGGGRKSSKSGKKSTLKESTEYEDTFNQAISAGYQELKNGTPWGDVWNTIKEYFPDVPNENIDAVLGGEEGADFWRQQGAFNTYTMNASENSEPEEDGNLY